MGGRDGLGADRGAGRAHGESRRGVHIGGGQKATLEEGGRRHSGDGAPNYHPNSFSGPVEDIKAKETSFKVTGDVDRYNSADDDNFTQAGIFYREVLNEEEKSRLVSNIVHHVIDAKDFIQERAVKNFSQADPDYGRRIKEGLAKLKKERAKM
ncbi:Catalase like protein [Argiope bruennichi]|uniref:Catalase like protein n=1 Tax=Argiope bruennichi TaxID=94029 RepID=A0A8T0EKG1_ARGBR|nr:Catalase like protein [Argiope bruennichi]